MGDIWKIDKKIYVNKPIDNSYAQYNKGAILEGNTIRLMGKQRSNRANDETDLYTLVENKDNQNLINYPNGILNGIGSKIEIIESKTQDHNEETDKGKYTGVKFAFYVYDGDTSKGTSIGFAKTGNQIRDAIGTENGFDDTDNRVRY